MSKSSGRRGRPPPTTIPERIGRGGDQSERLVPLESVFEEGA